MRASLGEEVTKSDLGGPSIAVASGVIQNLAQDDRAALDQIKVWLSYLPSSAWQRSTKAQPEGPRQTPEILNLVPRNPRQAYDMRDVVEVVFDADSYFEIAPRFGASMLCGLAPDGWLGGCGRCQSASGTCRNHRCRGGDEGDEVHRIGKRVSPAAGIPHRQSRG